MVIDGCIAKEINDNAMKSMEQYILRQQSELIERKVIDDIKAEIKDLHNSHMINFVDADGAVDTCLEIINRHLGVKNDILWKN